MPEYRYRGVAEFLWFVGIAVATVLLQALVEFDPEKITNWQTWAIALGAAAVRAGAGAALAWVAKSRITA